MTDEQIQALEALYIAANGKMHRLILLNTTMRLIKAETLDDLRKQGFVEILGHRRFMLTRPGVEKAIANRHKPPADS